MTKTRARGTVITQAHFPGCVPIDAYGNGGFRFADMSHQGALFVLPSGIYAWDAKRPEDITAPRLARVFDEAEHFELLFLGTGRQSAPLDRQTRSALQEAAIRFEVMSTGAAVRTFNVLIAEGRAVAAALLPVADAWADSVK